MSELARWLEEHGLGKYEEVFAENDINLDVRADLSEDDLKELGISLDDRRRVLKAVPIRLRLVSARSCSLDLIEQCEQIATGDSRDVALFEERHLLEEVDRLWEGDPIEARDKVGTPQ